MTATETTTLSPLALAVAEFNEVFAYGISLPVDRPTVESMAYIAARRGRPDIADKLRAAV